MGLTNPSAALLLIIGEPFSEDHRALILEEIAKGFRCWDVEDTGIDINEELAQIANGAALGEEGVNGERLIQHQSENLVVKILVNPLAQTVKNSFKKLLIEASPTKYVIYAGHAFKGTGAWVLQDDVFSFNNLAQVFKNPEVEIALNQNIEANLTINTLAESSWGASISKADFTNSLRIQLNPAEKLDNIHGVMQFTAYLGTFVTVTQITDLLQASEQFGNISFTRPTLYIFPGCQGDSALFGVNGFNLLVNGGYNRRACFWDFARHLDRVDAMLLTHLGTDNIFGINTALQRKSVENIHPQIGYLYFNALDKLPLVGEDGDAGSVNKTPSLLINLAEEANKMTQMAKQLGITPHPCTMSAKSPTVDPINMYHKLGHGSLDMYILNPVGDSKELKELYQMWAKEASNLGMSGPFALQNAMSVCTLLVWKPYDLNEKIVRIFFPGNAPQHKVAEGLERMKSLAFLKHASCTAKDLQKPTSTKKVASARPGSGTSARGSARSSATMRNTTSTRLEYPRKADTARARPTSATSATKSNRPVRDDKPAKPKERPATVEVKDTKTRPSSTTCPTKSSSANPRKTPPPMKSASPAKSPSPPKSVSPPKSPIKGRSPEKEVKTSTSEPVIKKEIQITEYGEPVSNIVQTETNQDKPDQQHKTEEVQNINEALFGSVPEQEANFKTSMSKPSQDLGINGDIPHGKLTEILSPTQVNGNGDSEEAEIRPQALPEPTAIVESPSLESPCLSDYRSKIESDQQELSEFSKVEQELEESGEEAESIQDPAEAIPPSPEPSCRDQPDIESFTPSGEAFSVFETPVFTNDEPNGTTSQESMEQKIQYGIDESSRAMAGIQEVDEDDQEEDVMKAITAASEMIDRQAGVYEDEYEQEQNNGFENDNADDEIKQNVRNPDEELVEKDIRDNVKEKCVAVDSRSSAERQFEDVDDDANGHHDEGIGDEEDGLEKEAQAIQSSTLPAAFDKDSSSEVCDDCRDDTDSLDGGNPDDDENINETVGQHINCTNGKESSPSDCIDAVNNSKVPTAHLDGEDSDGEFQAGFDPVVQWGQPMGLPSPPPTSDGRKGATSPLKSNSSVNATSRSRLAADTKGRNGTAPAKVGPSRRGNSTRRPGSSRSSPQSAKVPPLPPLTPFYMDLTYIPNHGDPQYSDVEFFKRVRARYYVLSALSPNPQVLDSLMEAKMTWEQKDLEVTLIPTYDNETLRHWMGLNKEKLQELRIDMTPAVSRCTIQLQDLETSLPAYRLEV